MYISELKIWNFRKYGIASNTLDIEKPNLIVPFTKGLNVLIGENDAGKSTILDAIKLVLKTHAYEWIKVEDSDFFHGTEKLRIEIHFKGITDNEASHFTEWLGSEDEEIENEGILTTQKRPKLILIYQAEKNGNRIMSSDIKAGMDGVGHMLNSEARDYLKCTYLKALRDADNELMAKKNSRLSQILQEHNLFKKTDKQHDLEVIFESANKSVKEYFNNTNSNGLIKSNKEQLIGTIDEFIKEFIDETYNSEFGITKAEIKTILEKMSLGIEAKNNLGLGTMNRLFMSAELLHLKKEWDGLKLCIIEELEAHLHPQAQMKIVKKLVKEANKNIQIILTTHSPNIASVIDLKSLIICKNKDVFPMGQGNTKLESANYKYLQKFLDVTKSNLFFAKGVIIVEGWSEEILLPVIAQKLGYDFTSKEISIVNVGSTAYLHFAKIFLRNGPKNMNIPVSIVTDLDNKPDENGIFKTLDNEFENVKTKQENLKQLKVSFDNTNVSLEIAKEWTLEWCFYKSTIFSNLFKNSVSIIHSGTDEFKNENGNFNDSKFQEKFIKKLSKKDGTSPLDKVAVATELAKQIDESDLKLDKSNLNDEYISYLVDAIKHVCNDIN